MTIDQFYSLFSGCMPNINWDRARRERWEVDHTVVSTRVALSQWNLVISKEGRFGDGGKLITLGEVPGNLHLFGQDWRQKALAIAAEMEKEPLSIPIVVPAINNTILDGNHRCVAIMLGAFDFSVLICSVYPPNGIIWGDEDYA